MQRRTLIGGGLAGLLFAGNVGVWYARRQPADEPPDTRDVLRERLESEWAGLETTPLANAEEAIGKAVGVGVKIQDGAGNAIVSRQVSFWALDEDEQRDLVDAVAGAVTAIAENDPGRVLRYMADRGLKPNPAALQRFEPSAARDPTQGFRTAWDAVGVEPHWDALVPGGTYLRVWRPRSLRHVSITQLGVNESWVWGAEALYPTVFTGRPTYEQVSRREPALLADARFVIQHDETLDHERSPYFLRFWHAEEAGQWRPLALKLVRTGGDPGEAGPVLLF